MKRYLKIAVWTAALLFLAAVMILVNLPDGRVQEGAEEGEKLPDFSLTCIDGSTFTLSEQRGKTVIINLWATWCTPCVKELPDFDRLYRERREEVTVLAVHVPPVTADVEDYLSRYDYVMPFAVDGDGALDALLNESAVLPQTVIVSGNGIVSYNREGAVGYEELVRLIGQAGK